jgi:hypothetical protein
MSSSSPSFSNDMAAIFAFAQASLPAVLIAVAVLVASLFLLKDRNGASRTGLSPKTAAANRAQPAAPVQAERKSAADFPPPLVRFIIDVIIIT